MILIAAVAIGLLAAFFLFNYIKTVEDRANADAERVPVLVVREDIPKGTPGETVIQQAFVAEDKIPKEFLPATAIRDVDQIAGKVSFNDFSANQILVDGMFVDPAISQVGVSQRLEADEVAVSVPISGANAVSGLLVPGDEVDILVRTAIEAGQGAGSEGVTAQPSRLLYHEAMILAIGSATPLQAGEAPDPEAPAAVPTGDITFVLPVDAAQLLASVPAETIQLALTGPDYSAKAIPAIEPGDFETFPGETESSSRFGQLTPYGPDGKQ
jgi:pilus assembly protein CpaB